MTTSSKNRVVQASKSFNWIIAMLLAFGLFAPFASGGVAAPAPAQRGIALQTQQRDGAPPPLNGVFGVTVVGDVANVVGQIPLSPNGDGTWTGTAALSPGSYDFQFSVSTNSGEVIIGENGEQSPPANPATVTVPDNSFGAVFGFDENTGAVSSGGLVVEVSTDVGQFQTLPTSDGNYEVFFNVSPGAVVNVQPILLGTPTGEVVQVSDAGFGRVHVVVGPDGAIRTAESVQTASLTVFRTDDAGNPLPGACFTAYGGRNSVAAQACDSNDGAVDGITTLRFPDGVPGGVDLVETFTPDGQETSDQQSVNIGPGDNQLQAVVAGAAPPETEPAPEGPVFTLTFFAVDLAGNPLPGACFAIDDQDPVCDDDFDGTVVIPNVPAGPVTLRETTSPDGYQRYPDYQLEITRDEAFSVPHEVGTSEPVTEPTTEPASGSTVNITSTDESGNPLPFACYSIDGGDPVCDDDGDGVTTFTGVDGGRKDVSQVQTPEGYERADDFGIRVNDDVENETVEHRPIAEPTAEVPTGFTAGFVAIDANQTPLPFACYTLDGGDEQCDDDGDGLVTFEGVSIGLHTLEQTVPPDGYQNVGSLQVDVQGDQNFAVRHEPALEPTEVPTEETTEVPTEEAVSGFTVGFVSVDPDDNAIPGACFTLNDGPEVCDDDGDGEVTFTGVQAGPQTLTETQPPAGFDNVGSVDLDVQGDGRFAIRHTPSAGQVEGVGSFVVTTLDQDGNELPGVCYSISELGEQCDGDDPDNVMTQTEVPAGDYVVSLVVPDGYEAVGATEQTVTVEPEGTASIQFQVQIAGGEGIVVPPGGGDGVGSLEALPTDSGFPIPGACVVYEGPASGQVCDNDANDQNPEAGPVRIGDLPSGTYAVSIPNPPEGYAPSGPVTAEVQAGQQTNVELAAGAGAVEPTPEGPLLGDFRVVKRDPDGARLGGSCFALTGEQSLGPWCDGDPEDTDDRDGVMEIQDLPVGDYTLTETQAPEGFLPVADQPITITAGERASISIVDEIAAGSIQIAKTDADGNPLAGACFSVGEQEICDNADGDESADDGVIVLGGIAPGSVDVSETSAPEGYVSDGTTQTVDVTAGGFASVTFTNQRASGSIRVEKVDESGAPLAGACFLIGGAEICDNGNGDSNGDAGVIEISDVPTGQVDVSESVAPEGYAASPDTQTLTVAAGESATLSFVNVRLTGTIQISKVDADGASLGGACFVVDDIEVCDNADGDTNSADGVIEIANVPTGDVTISESVAPAGYDASDEAQSVTVVSGETVTATFVNDAQTGAIQILKVGPDGEALAGACFQVGENEICDNAEGDTSADDGVIVSSGVALGTVEVRETTPPAGFVASPETQTLTVNAGETATATFVNTAESGVLRINKVDSDGAAIAGACFLVGEQAVCDNDEADAAAEDGVIELTGLPVGEVVVSETAAPDGFVLSAESQTGEITNGAVTEVTFTNQRAVGSLLINKVDVLDLTLSLGGACFEVEGGPSLCDNDENDADPADGKILLENVPVGSYVLTESQAPEGYSPGASIAIEIVADEVTTVTVGNSAATGSLRIAKVDSADGSVLLPGACFAIDGGDPICDNSDADADPADGAIEISGLPAGERELAETTAPAGFAIGDPVPVTIVAGQTAEVTVPNVRSEGTIRIEKVDAESSDPLGGACFTVDDQEPVCDNDANDGDPADGVIVITAAPGDRLVSETTAPDGYQALADPQTVTVVDGEAADVSFPNTRFAGALAISKLDNSNDEPLAGACFELEGDAQFGPICDNGDGDADPAEGALLLQGVEPGTYNLIESTTPEGFVVAEGPVAVGIQIAAGETAALTVANEPVGSAVVPPAVDTGSVRLSLVDADGNPLAGGCFSLTADSPVGPVCDNQDGDADSAEGSILIENVPTGAYTVEQTLIPDGFTAGPIQQVVVVSGEEATVEVVNTTEPAGTGNLRIRSLDSDDNPIGGACYSNGPNSVCDNQAGDADPVPGEILVTGLQVGSYTLTQSRPPTGFAIAAPQDVEVVADQETIVEFVHEPAPLETGNLEFQLRDPDGNPVEGDCVTLSDSGNQSQDLVFCDGGADDADPRPAVLLLEDIPVGTYSVRQSNLPEGDAAGGVNAANAALPVSEKTVEVKANTTVVVIIIIIVQQPTNGSLEIVKRAADTNLIQPGACFEVTGQGNTVEACDNDVVDANATEGIIRFEDLKEGTYSVTETLAPAGYDPVENQDVVVFGGSVTTITIKDPPTPDQIGDLTILKVDPDGNFIPGTCFELLDGVDSVAGPICDIDDGADDGEIFFADIAPGAYTVRETQAASDDYKPVPDQPVTIVAGVDTELPVVNEFKPGSILITKLADTGDEPLTGACFGLDRGDGIEYEVCDQQAGDSDLREGIIQIRNVPPGEYTLVETVAPIGFDPGLDTQVTVEPNTEVELSIRNQPAVPPTETGNLTILKKNPTGQALAGSCFALKVGQVIKVPAVCDGDDGANDGTITFTSVGVGTYATVETRKPSADYQLAPEKFVTIVKDQTVTVSITNSYKPGRILVQKVNEQDAPLASACFKVTPGTAPVKCTDGTGNVVFDNLLPGVYTVTETSPPYGYLIAPPVTNIVVTPGLTSPVKIVDKKAPPPPDAGSLRVIKFFCPLPEGSTLKNQVFDSSDPGTKTLAQTSNCTKGDATFVLQRTTGDVTAIKFSTGSDGETQLTLPAGIYTLTEQATKVSVQIQVFVGQQTTVVVLNYVPPPKPAPVAINVYKYTCDPGFKGQYYLDFIGGCGDYEALTNNVTFRVSGAALATRVTGAAGERGRALFTQLPSGQFTLSEEVPTGVGSVFAWCGLSLESSEYGAVGSTISFPLASGQTMWCAFFNVPDEVTDTTGVIVVNKFSCALPQVKRPANFDWAAECDIQTTPAKFGLSVMQEGAFVPKTSGLTDVNGILKFGDLKPGTYKLEELGADWCHAESDTVDAQGNVIVRAGHRSNVWIYNCVATVEPPNTGAGTTAMTGTAETIVSPADSSNTAMLAIWPFGLMAGLVLRKRSTRRAA